jgi:hypothetical protein
MDNEKTYYEKLKDPRWQKKRLAIMQRDEFRCCFCGEDKITLNVHHIEYSKTRNPWDTEDNNLVTLCENCHETESNNQYSKDYIYWFFKRHFKFPNILIDSIDDMIKVDMRYKNLSEKDAVKQVFLRFIEMLDDNKLAR